MPTSTTNFGLSKPLVNNPIDQDKFGDQINDDIDSLDSVLFAALNFQIVAKTISFGVTAPTAGSDTIADSKKLFLCDCTAGSISATLPAANTTGNGFVIGFKKTDSSASYSVTLSPDGSDTIDGESTYVLSSQYDWVILASDDSASWHVISKSPPVTLSTTIADKSVLGNISGSATTPYAVDVSALLDAVLTSTQGSIAYRGSSGWAALTPGTSGQYLKTQGASANPAWSTVSTAYVSQDQNYNNVGSLCLCHSTSAGAYAAGSTLAGSYLYPACLIGGSISPFTALVMDRSSTALTGTWRCLGYGSGHTTYGKITLYQRIA